MIIQKKKEPPKEEENLIDDEAFPTEEAEVSIEETDAPEVDMGISGGSEPVEKDSEPDGDSVLIDRDLLKGLKEQLEAQGKKIETLTKVAPQDQLARHTPKAPIGRSVRVATVDGLLVVGWTDMKPKDNYVSYRSGERVENQVMTLLLEDKTEKRCQIHEFHDLIETEWVEVDLSKCSFEIDNKGNPGALKEISFIWKGQETKIKSTFINP